MSVFDEVVLVFCNALFCTFDEPTVSEEGPPY